MVKITIDTPGDGDTLVLSVKGHTGFAEPGKDIVCSAVSMLTITFAQCVRDFYAEKKLRKKPTIKLKEGDSTVTCKPLNAERENVACAFSVVATGFKLLATNYPDYVRLTMFGTPYHTA